MPMSIEDILVQARQYSLEEEIRLVEELLADLRQRIKSSPMPRCSILEFEDKARGIDEFIRQVRASWGG